MTNNNNRQRPAYIWEAMLLLFLLLPNFFVAFFSYDLAGDVPKQAAYLFFSLLVWLVPAVWLRSRIYFICMGVLLIPAPLEIGYVLTNGSSLTEGILSAVFHTDRTEMGEVLTSYRHYLPLILLYWGSYAYICFRKIPNRPLPARRIRMVFLLFFVVFNVGLWGLMLYKAGAQSQDMWGRLNQAQDIFAKKYRRVYPCNFFYLSGCVWENMRKMNTLQKELSAFSFGCMAKNTDKGRQICVLVIGESARSDHFSLNGYDRCTTPRLDTTGNIVSFRNARAAANLTEYVLPFILTRATPKQPDAMYKEKGLPDAFREAGFHTAWIANQGDNYPLINRMAKDADFSYYITVAFNSPLGRDEHLLPVLDSVLERGENCQLIVVHTRGSHSLYDQRYPENFRHFTPVQEMDDALSSDLSEARKDRLINSYDNSILYTDFILSEIIERLKQENAVSFLVYLSDHAECLFDGPDKFVLHGNTTPPVNEVHIPLFVWMSDLYQQSFPEQVRHLSANRDRRVGSVNLFHSFLDMAGLRYPDERRELSFASPSFQEDSVSYVLTPDQRVIAR